MENNGESPAQNTKEKDGNLNAIEQVANVKKGNGKKRKAKVRELNSVETEEPVTKLRLRKRKCVNIPTPVWEKDGTPVCAKNNIETSPSHHHTKSPVVDSNNIVFEHSPNESADSENTPSDESLSSEEDFVFTPNTEVRKTLSKGDFVNVNASETEGYDSEWQRENAQASQHGRKSVDYSNIDTFKGEDHTGPEVDTRFAKVLDKNWWELDKSCPDTDQQLKLLFKKYVPPANCCFEPPMLNVPIRTVLTANQKSIDMSFANIQKSLAKSMNAVLNLFDEAHKESPNFQSMAKTVGDISAILGDASHEISRKRRAFCRGSLPYEYKTLCNSRGSKKLLFGERDDLKNDLEDLDLSNRLRRKTYLRSQHGRRHHHQNEYHNNVKKPFLRKGRGNLPYEKYGNSESKHQKRHNSNNKSWKK